MAEDGAAICDVGAESTRPGAAPVDGEEQLARLSGVLRALRVAPPPLALSIDTSLATVAEAALDAGFVLVNDVTAGRADPRLLPLVAERGAAVCLVHMLGDPRTMQQDPSYDDVVADVRDELAARLQAAVDAGVPEERVILDPGIGFGKTLEHNLALLAGVPRLAELGRPVLIGVSRKSMFRRLLGRRGGRAHARVDRGRAGGGRPRRGGAARPRRARDGRRPARVGGGRGGRARVSADRLTVRVRGLEAFGHHGVHAAEQELGQRFVVDLDIDLREPLASRTDELVDTVDYASLADAVCALVSGPPGRAAGAPRRDDRRPRALEEPWARAVDGDRAKAPRRAAPDRWRRPRSRCAGRGVAATPIRWSSSCACSRAAFDARDEGALLGLVCTRSVGGPRPATGPYPRPRGGRARGCGRAPGRGRAIERDGAELVSRGARGGARAPAPGRRDRAAPGPGGRGARRRAPAAVAMLRDRAAAGL